MAIRTLRRSASNVPDANQKPTVEPAVEEVVEGNQPTSEAVVETPVVEETPQAAPTAETPVEPEATEVAESSQPAATPKPAAKKKEEKEDPLKGPYLHIASVANRLTFEEAAFGKSLNMSDFVNLLFTELSSKEVITKKTIEDFASTFFTDLIPTLMDNKAPISLGALRITYGEVKQRIFPANTNLNAKVPLDVLVKTHSIAKFKREINKETVRGKLSDDKKTFTVEGTNEVISL